MRGLFPISAIRAMLFRAQIEPGLHFRRTHFPVPQEAVSTPTEKTDFWLFFSKLVKNMTF